MKGKAVSGIMLTVLLTSMLTLAFNIQPVGASGTIYIRPDGTVEGTDKIQRDGDVYTFTDNIYDRIVVEIDNIVVDGAGYTLQGTKSHYGINMTRRSNVTIQNVEIKAFHGGIWLENSSNSILSGNNITANNRLGICLVYSSNNNSVYENNITNNFEGILLSESSNNSISGNNITNNLWSGIVLHGSSNYNSVSGNNITNNDLGVHLFFYSVHNIVSGNNITNNDLGVRIEACNNNNISENDIKNNDVGVWLGISLDNTIYHNNFIDNPQQVYDFSWEGVVPPSVNTWDNNYPSGGNHWSDHVTVDDCCGVNQDELGSDGIVDEPYVIDDYNGDNYPLVEPWSPLPRTIGELKTEIEKCWSEGKIDNQGIVKSLLAKLNVAQKLVDKGKIDEAKSILEDDFIPQVQNLSDIHITIEAADILIKSAEYIMSNL